MLYHLEQNSNKNREPGEPKTRKPHGWIKITTKTQLNHLNQNPYKNRDIDSKSPKKIEKMQYEVQNKSGDEKIAPGRIANCTHPQQTQSQSKTREELTHSIHTYIILYLSLSKFLELQY